MIARRRWATEILGYSDTALLGWFWAAGDVRFTCGGLLLYYMPCDLAGTAESVGSDNP